MRRFGGTPAGPVWSTDTPFACPATAMPPVLARKSGVDLELSWPAVAGAASLQV